MKTQLAIVVFFTCALVQAQGDAIPEIVGKTFMEKYPVCRQEGWWMENDLYHIDFSSKGRSYVAVFDSTGTWKETAESISDMDIPQTLRSYIQKNFPSGKISFCEEVESPGTKKFLRVNLFDQGNVLRIICCDPDGRNIMVREPEQVSPADPSGA